MDDPLYDLAYAACYSDGDRRYLAQSLETMNRNWRPILKQIAKGSYRATIPPSLVALVDAQLKGVHAERSIQSPQPLPRMLDVSARRTRTNTTGLLKLYSLLR